MSTTLVTSYLVAYNRLRLMTGAQIAGLWDRFGGLDDTALALFTASAVQTMRAAETTQARLTIGYLTALRKQTLGSAPTVNLDIRELTGANLRGVDPTEVFARPTVTARTAISEGKDFAEAIALGRQRATELATTNVMLTQRATVSAMGKTDKRVVGYRRVLTGASCNLCQTVSTQRYHRGDLHPIHSHCVIGSTVVSARSPREVSRRWYEGQVVIVGTAAGNELTVTPNHPILTSDGWVLAGELHEGMNLIGRTPGNRVVDGVPNEDDVPSRIEDRFRAGSVHALVAVPFASEDFHGDRGDGDVDVVPTNRHLGNGVFAEFAQPGRHFPFTIGEPSRVGLTGLCETHEFLLGLRHASDGSVSGGGLSETLFGSHSSGSVLTRSRTATWLDAIQDQMASNSTAVDANPLRDGQLGLTSDVTLDRITELRRVHRRCQVFNLHTENGWYYASNIVVHNCDCGVAEIYGTADPGRVINSKLLGELKSKQTAEGVVRSEALHSAQQRSSQAATRIREMRAQLPGESGTARTARLEDRLAQWEERKSTADREVAAHRAPQVDEPVVHIHGELGPLLTVKGHHFDGPSVVH